MAGEAGLPGLAYKNADDEDMTYVSHMVLDAARAQVMASSFPDVGAAKAVYAVLAKKDEAMKEFVAVVGADAEAPKLVMGSCQITYEDLTPSECIEYSFPEEPHQFAMTQLSEEALETYRGMKFAAWKGMLEAPTCEAQFRRMLQIGMIAELFDPQVFPTPEVHKSKYEVTDEKTGKRIQLPHPVAAMRIWDVAAQAYRPIDSRLTGAPSKEEQAEWWASLMEEMKKKHGAEYIAGLVEGK